MAEQRNQLRQLRQQLPPRPIRPTRRATPLRFRPRSSKARSQRPRERRSISPTSRAKMWCSGIGPPGDRFDALKPLRSQRYRNNSEIRSPSLVSPVSLTLARSRTSSMAPVPVRSSTSPTRHKSCGPDSGYLANARTSTSTTTARSNKPATATSPKTSQHFSLASRI